MKLHLFLLVFSLLQYINSYGGVCTTTGNGHWNTAGTWSCGNIPGCNDTIIINHYVTFNSTIDYTKNPYNCPNPMYIVINGPNGVLYFASGRKLTLPCGSSILINSGGSIQTGNYNGNSENIQICNSTVWQASSGQVTGPSSFGSGLPVELIYFKAEAKGNIIKINWATASEINNERFEIEKSKNGVTWEVAEKKPGLGSSSSVVYYTLNDNNPYYGLSYYRLKQVDYDGSYSYSQIVAVEVKISIDFSVYPNPAKDELYIQFSNQDFSESELRIFSTDGKLVDSVLLTGYKTLYNTSALPSGSYYLSVVSRYEAVTHKLIKQ
ncbi:MAG: T9SS type A sorting domain-containing protein [Flavobacteriales bacterium]